MGETMDGAQALRFGLAHEVLNDDVNVREESADLLRRLSVVAGVAYASTKHRMLNALDATYQQSQLMV